MYSAKLGRFVGRDSFTRAKITFGKYIFISTRRVALDGYQDGFSLYSAYMVPGKVDPSGLCCEDQCTTLGQNNLRVDSVALRPYNQSVDPGAISDVTDGISNVNTLSSLVNIANIGAGYITGGIVSGVTSALDSAADTVRPNPDSGSVVDDLLNGSAAQSYMRNVGASIWVHTSWDCCKSETCWVFWEHKVSTSSPGKWTSSFGWGGVGYQADNLAQGIIDTVSKALTEARGVGCQ